MPITFVGVGTFKASSGGTTGSLIPTLPTGLQVGDLVLIFCSGRNTGYVFTATGYTQKWSLDHSSSGINTIVLLYRRYQSGDGDPTVSWTGGATNATVIIQICAFRGVDNAEPFNVQGATSSNASQANIGPITGITTGINGKCTIVFGHRADDWTSVAALTGDGLTWNEIGEPDSTSGTDAGMVWDYAIHGGSQSITAKTFTVTGGLANYGMGVIQSLNEALTVIVERNLSESLGAVSDSVAIAVRRNVPVSEPSISVSDETQRVLTHTISISEASISLSDSTERAIRRVKEVSEPSITVSDAVSRGLFLSRGPVESFGGVTDAPITRTTRAIAIGEGPISVQDAILINLKKNIAVSETVLFSDSITTQTTRVKTVAEPSLSVSDAVSESVRRSIALSEPNIVFSELVTHSIQRSITAPELILMSDSVSTAVTRNIEVLESITVFDSASINLIRSVVLTEIDIFVNDLATALALITTKTVNVDVSEPPIMFSDAVDVCDSKNIDILEDLGLISDSPIAEVLRDGLVLQQNLIVSLLQYFDSHSIVGLTRDRRIIAKASYKQIVGSGMVPLTVRIPDLKYIENILHVQMEILPDPTAFYGPFWKRIEGNVVGMSIYQAAGVTVCTEVTAVGPP